MRDQRECRSFLKSTTYNIGPSEKWQKNSQNPRTYVLSLAIRHALTLAGANKPLVMRRSLAMTIPSLARIPTQVPALLMASMAYSTYIYTCERKMKGSVWMVQLKKELWSSRHSGLDSMRRNGGALLLHDDTETLQNCCAGILFHKKVNSFSCPKKSCLPDEDDLQERRWW